MLEKPDISDDTIIACLRDAFGLPIAHVSFLPLGWVHNAMYRVIADSGTPYFLKLRRGNFNVHVRLSASPYLKSEQLDPWQLGVLVVSI